MSRVLGLGLSVVLLAGCIMPAERVPLRPLVEGGPPAMYADLLIRARVLATAATEAFYVNGWADLEEFGRGLEQTARFLPKAVDVPPNQKGTLPAKAGELEKEARQLQAAARAQKVKEVNDIMQRINLMVRELRIDK
jgi:hypothetical protein